jgi:anti-sigma B factor antagonist
MTASSLVQVDQQGDLCVVFLNGELDIAVGPQVVNLGRAMIESTSADRIAVDMAGVTFMDSSGVAALLALRSAARERDLPFRVVSASRGVCRVLEISGLLSALDVVEVHSDAATALPQAAGQ